jgi:6-phosphogluconolactonase (cycloisomerase 2 family)
MVGSGMVLQNNGGDDLSISANSSFSFAMQLTDGAAYSVTVKTQPTNPSQTCTVSNGSATVNGARVVSVVVNCVTGPTSVAVDPSGKFAYATNTNGTISAYTINQTTGALTAGTAVAAGTYPSSITVDPSGKFAYVANMGDNTISTYTIDPTYGTLTVLGTAVAAGTSPSSIISVHLSAGEFVYVANVSDKTIWFYSINSSNGKLTYLGKVAAGTYPSSVTVDPLGRFAYAANMGGGNILVYKINSDGTLTPQ